MFHERPDVKGRLIFTAWWLLPLRAGGQTLAEATAAVDGCVVKAEPRQLVGPVAEVVGLDKSFVEKALAGGGLRISDLVFAGLLLLGREQKGTAASSKGDR
jgi:hypothetical protein